MISTLGVIIVAVGASVCCFVAGAVAIILVLRANDRKRRSKEEVARQLNAGQRSRLTVGSSNYSHVREPRTNLRKSTHLPYGVVSQGWVEIPSQESLAPYPKSLANDRPEAAGSQTPQKRRRSLRASFSAHSFSLPKTRRQKQIERAVPLRAMPRSPLSAITERSGTNTNEASPSVGLPELPTEITPKSTPDRDGDALRIKRSLSPQWPLTSVSCDGAPTIIPVPASPDSTLMRTNSTDHKNAPVRPSLGQRSTSVTSTLSIAPEDPLPPLPSTTPNQWPLGRKSRLRLSVASVDTIGSSLLGGGQMSPPQTDTDLTSIGLSTPSIHLNPIRLQTYERGTQNWEPVTVITTGSPKARHPTKYRTGRAGYGSLRASIGSDSSLKRTSIEQVAESKDQNSFRPLPLRSASSTTDPSNWKSHLPSRANSLRSYASPSLPLPVSRMGSGYKRGTVTARHSMYEQHTGIGRMGFDPAVLRDVSGNQASPMRRRASSRPASVASENPFHWDRNSLQTGLPSSLRSSPGSERKGHKRQNCVRIANLPAVDTSRRASKLPQMREEEEDSTSTPVDETVMIPGLSLLEREKPADRADPRHEHPGTSPFLNRPALEPTPCKRPRYSRASSSESMTSCDRDSDVFSNSRYDPIAPNIFTENLTPRRHWPLSPTVRYAAGSQPTTPSLNAIQEPCDPDSPTLPMPAISSAMLFARALPVGARVSGVQGPRNIPTSSRSSRMASPTLVVARAAAKREDLRRSVMTLRRTSSDTMNRSRLSPVYRNIGGEKGNSSLDVSEGDEQLPATQTSVRGEIAGMGISTPNTRVTAATNLQIPGASNQRGSVSPSGAGRLASGGFRLSKSRGNMAPSTSVMSVSTTSIWEDASVRGDSPEQDQSTSSKASSPRLIDLEAYENFVGQDTRSQKDKVRESRLTSPQGKGLGLTGVQVQGKVWGTPGSLYDREGFLKE